MPLAPVEHLASPYSLHPTENADVFSIMNAERKIAEIRGEWAVRIYRLLQGEGDLINCYLGANFVLKNSLCLDGRGNAQMLMKGAEISFDEGLQQFGIPMGVQWGTQEIGDEDPRHKTDHMHSAVVITPDSEDNAILFEIPGYVYAARITTLAEVHQREMEKADRHCTIHRHFYKEDESKGPILG